MSVKKRLVPSITENEAPILILEKRTKRKKWNLILKYCLDGRNKSIMVKIPYDMIAT
nr:unnamed protein product [Callosobruchus analis]